ncbi:hypothetical protein M0D21_02680 [Aquimarina sp. D1M17]|uniref:hypothetical protein n=1 Tax=Aquimarina acroporae TaxID=2937283 RepID=UPI0020BD856F|nr:hypothetical protein [Aquimarina acroporae]MCK8520454.1 hypothetical protein [Aquimarina acroporae]
MEILKIATEWAKAEVFSSKFFILFAILLLIASVGFWQLGRSETAKAYIFPTLVAGMLLLAVGIGILIANTSRISSFENAYTANPSEFIKSEIVRTEKSMKEYSTIVFKIIPCIIIIAALFIIFVDKPYARAICITTIAMMIVILLVDSNANARIKNYHNELKLADK